MNDVEQIILARLNEGLSPIECRLDNESALHAGHPGAASGGGHFRLHIVAPAFKDKNRVQRHRLVYDCLGDMMKNRIHALAITALSPEEISAPGKAEVKT